MKSVCVYFFSACCLIITIFNRSSGKHIGIGGCHLEPFKSINGPIETNTHHIGEGCGVSALRPCLAVSGIEAYSHKCFKLTLPESGSETYVYVVHISNGFLSFEVEPSAWLNLCPVLCINHDGTHTCRSTAEACENGPEKDQGNIPAPCTIEFERIFSEEVACLHNQTTKRF